MTAAGPEANVLGALSLVIADLTAERVAAAAGQSVSSAAALSAMGQFLDRPTLDQLRRVLGLTHSGAVRLVDRLAAAGLVERGPGGDGRSRSVVLTEAGRRAAERIAAVRADLLAGFLADLTPEDRRNLHGLLSRIMSNVVRAKEGGAWICRLCDLEACGRPAGRCPAAAAAVVKYRNHSGA